MEKAFVQGEAGRQQPSTACGFPFVRLRCRESVLQSTCQAQDFCHRGPEKNCKEGLKIFAKMSSVDPLLAFFVSLKSP